MSRYEQVCDMLRQRRKMREKAIGADRRWTGEVEHLAVIQDALVELGPLFRHDVKECQVQMGGGIRGRPKDRERCILLQQYDWPLQSRLDA
jgi:hypothetical protein